MNLW